MWAEGWGFPCIQNISPLTSDLLINWLLCRSRVCLVSIAADFLASGCLFESCLSAPVCQLSGETILNEPLTASGNDRWCKEELWRLADTPEKKTWPLLRPLWAALLKAEVTKRKHNNNNTIGQRSRESRHKLMWLAESEDGLNKQTNVCHGVWLVRAKSKEKIEKMPSALK